MSRAGQAAPSAATYRGETWVIARAGENRGGNSNELALDREKAIAAFSA
jgi:hypothetical protein